MTNKCAGFAAYRLPGESSPHLIIQEGGNIATDEMWYQSRQKGFVMMPFLNDETKPSIFIREDINISDKQEIINTINNFSLDLNRKKYSRSDSYHEAFSKFITPLADGTIQKLVLSCSKQLLSSSSPAELFEMACNKYPRMMVCLSYTPQTGLWIGCTPEIILEKFVDTYHTIALAGTQKLVDDMLTHRWDEKNIREQKIVSDYICDTIATFAHTFNVSAPFTHRAGHIAHLRTDFYFRIAPGTDILTVLKALHPTPAVCGLPKDKAFKFINENEGYDRRYYAGIIGPVDYNEMHLYVNLRCAEIFSNCLFLYVGSGLLPESEEETEYLEISEKMKTIKSIL
jgi:isochorismate synthase